MDAFGKLLNAFFSLLLWINQGESRVSNIEQQHPPPLSKNWKQLAVYLFCQRSKKTSQHFKVGIFFGSLFLCHTHIHIPMYNSHSVVLNPLQGCSPSTALMVPYAHALWSNILVLLNYMMYITLPRTDLLIFFFISLT